MGRDQSRGDVPIRSFPRIPALIASGQRAVVHDFEVAVHLTHAYLSDKFIVAQVGKEMLAHNAISEHEPKESVP